MKTAAIGDVAGPRGGVRDRAGDVVGPGDERRDEDRDDRVDGRIGGEDREERGAKSSADAAAIRSTGLRERRLGRGERAQGALELGRERRDVEPVPGAGVGARMPGPPALVTIATRRPGGQRLVGEQRGDVEQLVERVGADHAGLAEQRVDRRRRRRPAARRCARRRRARPRPSARLDGDDRLRAARRAARSGRTCAGSRTTRGTAGSRRWPASSSQYWRKSLPERSALLPTETNDDRPSPSVARRCSSSAIPSRRSARGTPTVPGGGAVGREGRVQPHRRAVLRTPRQFGPTSRMPARGRSSSSSCWRATPSSPTSAKPAEITTSAPSARAAHSRATSTTAAAGIATTARSTGPATSRTDRWSAWPTTARRGG